MNDLDQFRQLFSSAFRNPRQIAPLLCTKRFGAVWVELTPIEDWLCGPLYAINQRGECDYVFTDTENRFPDIVTPDDFLQWCLALATKYRDGVLPHVPRSDAERADQNILLQMADEKVTLSHLAYKIITNP